MTRVRTGARADHDRPTRGMVSERPRDHIVRGLSGDVETPLLEATPGHDNRALGHGSPWRKKRAFTDVIGGQDRLMSPVTSRENLRSVPMSPKHYNCPRESTTRKMLIQIQRGSIPVGAGMVPSHTAPVVVATPSFSLSRQRSRGRSQRIPPALRARNNSPRPHPGQTINIQRTGSRAVGLTLDEDLQVISVARGSAAEAAGVQPGVRLCGIGSRRVHSQAEAVDMFKASGTELSLHVVTPHAAPHEFGMIAGRTSATPQRDRKAHIPSPIVVSGPDWNQPRSQSAELAMKRKGLGVPGLGPQPAPWGDNDSRHNTPTAAARSQSVGARPLREQPNTAFKPQNAHVAPGDRARYGIGSGRGSGNKTSYEMAADKGHINQHGHWHGPVTPRSLRTATREEYMRRNHNGNILEHNPSYVDYDRGSPHGSIRRGYNPKSPAIGHVPMDETPGSDRAGRRTSSPHLYKNNSPHNFDSDFLRHEHTVYDASGPPGRCAPREPQPYVRHAHQNHGDISGGRFHPHKGNLQSPITTVKGAKRTDVGNEPFVPMRSPMCFRSTLCHSNPNPINSDIFHHKDHRNGACGDMPDSKRGKAFGRDQSPARWSDIAG